jgi:hypothetical protein
MEIPMAKQSKEVSLDRMRGKFRVFRGNRNGPVDGPCSKQRIVPAALLANETC